MKVTLLKTCIRGKKGQVVDIDPEDARILAANGIVSQSVVPKPVERRKKAAKATPKAQVSHTKKSGPQGDQKADTEPTAKAMGDAGDPAK